MKKTIILAAFLISLTGFSQTNSAIAFNSPVLNDETTGTSLVDFGAKHSQSKIDLKWITASEKNISHFQLERSLDGINYSVACVVFAYGNTTENKTYSFSDKVNKVQKQVIHYRLRSIDGNGNSQLSGTIRISKENQAVSILTSTDQQSIDLKISVPAA